MAMWPKSIYLLICDSDLFWLCEPLKPLSIPHHMWSLIQYRSDVLQCWTVKSEFMRLLCHSRSTFVTSLHSWESDFTCTKLSRELLKVVGEGQGCDKTHKWRFYKQNVGLYHKCLKTLLCFSTSLSLFCILPA